MSSPSGKRKADALDFTAPPNTTNATRTKGPSRVWNRCWAHTDVDAKGTQVPNGRYSLMVPNYPFTDEEGKAAAELMAKVALQQGTVEYKDHSKDNPTRRNEIVAYFYTPKGLGVLKQEAQKALGKPLSDTKGMESGVRPEARAPREHRRGTDRSDRRCPLAERLLPHVQWRDVDRSEYLRAQRCLSQR